MITGKKRRIEHTASQGRKPHAVGCSSTSDRPRVHDSTRSVGKPASVPHHAKPAPSNLLGKLATLHAGPTRCSEPTLVVRSSDLAEKPKPKIPESCAPSYPLHERGIEVPIASTSLATASQRDENLVIVEDLRMGPADHKPPPDDPFFERLEPNSGIHLLYVAFHSFCKTFTPPWSCDINLKINNIDIMIGLDPSHMGTSKSISAVDFTSPLRGCTPAYDCFRTNPGMMCP